MFWYFIVVGGQTFVNWIISFQFWTYLEHYIFIKVFESRERARERNEGEQYMSTAILYSIFSFLPVISVRATSRWKCFWVQSVKSCYMQKIKLHTTIYDLARTKRFSSQIALYIWIYADIHNMRPIMFIIRILQIWFEDNNCPIEPTFTKLICFMGCWGYFNTSCNQLLDDVL